MSNPNLLKTQHHQLDFFICDVFDSFKDDLASMEHPIFSLSKKPDFRVLEYFNNGFSIKVKPSYTGLATIFDKDILLFLASSLMNAKNYGDLISKNVRFTSYDYLVSTNKATGGEQYRQMKESLERLSGTKIQTNIKTNGVERTKEFGLINSWDIVKEDTKGKAMAIEVELSTWFYNSILGDEVLTIDKEYFRLRKPTDKRLYELARKHCGNQLIWKISLEKLKLKLGTTATLRALRFNMKKLVDANYLPEYNIKLSNKDIVTFTRRAPPKAPTKTQIHKAAKPGESTKQVRDKLVRKSQSDGDIMRSSLAKMREATK